MATSAREGAGPVTACNQPTVDHSYVSAALGLARVRLATGDLAGAVEVLA